MSKPMNAATALNGWTGSTARAASDHLLSGCQKLSKRSPNLQLAQLDLHQQVGSVSILPPSESSSVFVIWTSLCAISSTATRLPRSWQRLVSMGRRNTELRPTFIENKICKLRWLSWLATPEPYPG